MAQQSRHSTPMVIDAFETVHHLIRIRLGENAEEGRRETFIQELIHAHPGLIPTAEIEPAFAPLIPVCQELETPAGYVDNLFVTPWGGLALAECKLFRNPQSRREVVAQALDYARAIQGWHHDDLEAAVRKTLKRRDVSLYDLVREKTDLDEGQFCDAVERNLRVGRMLLLIVGDGIQEGVEALTEFLQLHAGLHVGVALIELSLWRMVDGGVLVVPRVPMKTVIIERGIVTIDANSAARIVPRIVAMPTVAESDRSRRVTLSEDEFFSTLEAHRPGLKPRLMEFVASLADLGVTLEIGRSKSAVLRWRPSPGTEASAGYIDVWGKVWLGSAYTSISRAKSTGAAEAYFEAVAGAAGGQVRRYEKEGPEVLDANGKALDADRLLSIALEWKAAISALTRDVGSGQGSVTDQNESDNLI